MSVFCLGRREMYGYGLEGGRFMGTELAEANYCRLEGTDVRITYQLA